MSHQASQETAQTCHTHIQHDVNYSWLLVMSKLCESVPVPVISLSFTVIRSYSIVAVSPSTTVVLSIYALIYIWNKRNLYQCTDRPYTVYCA